MKRVKRIAPKKVLMGFMKNNIRKHHIIPIGILLIMGGIAGGTIYVYFASLKNFARVMYTEVQQFQALHSNYHIPAPWAILLFGMGLLGIICVRMDERKKKNDISDNETMSS